MKRTTYALIAALFAASAASAQSCPASPDISNEVNALLLQAQNARTALEAEPVRPALWALWTKAPDDRAQDLLMRGINRLQSFDHDAAYAILTELIEYCPDYAEGYNQRAFVLYLTQNFAPALVDLEKALSLSPNHVAALSGKALTLKGLGREDASQEALRAALALNPWIPERGLLVEPPGEEL